MPFGGFLKAINDRWQKDFATESVHVVVPRSIVPLLLAEPIPIFLQQILRRAQLRDMLIGDSEALLEEELQIGPFRETSQLRGVAAPHIDQLPYPCRLQDGKELAG